MPAFQTFEILYFLIIYFPVIFFDEIWWVWYINHGDHPYQIHQKIKLFTPFKDRVHYLVIRMKFFLEFSWNYEFKLEKSSANTLLTKLYATPKSQFIKSMRNTKQVTWARLQEHIQLEKSSVSIFYFFFSSFLLISKH